MTTKKPDMDDEEWRTHEGRSAYLQAIDDALASKNSGAPMPAADARALIDAKLHELSMLSSIERGLADADAGRVMDTETLLARLEKRRAKP